MAMKTRRLFPDLSETNQTIDCSDDFCDPACPYNCYPYPDYYYLPPPPPPLPPPPLSDESHYISPYMIIFVSVLASFLLLVGYYVIVVKSCFGWCCWRNNRRLETQTDASDEEFVDENRVDHPIWFITTVGLQQSIINSITVCKYKKGEGLIEGTECSVCLNEFQEEEAVRLLPKCNHAFHISCIDTWLRAHTNCPLCRAHIVFNPPISADQNSDNIDVLVDNHIEISEIGGQVSGQNPGRNSELCENRARAEAARELPEANDQRISKETIYSDENGGLLDSDCIDRNQFVVKEITQIKRCVSMDSSSSSSSAASLFLGLPNSYPPKSEGSSFDQQENPNSSIIAKQDEVNSSEFTLMGNSSISHHLHLSPVPMKRSFSCGGRFFSSKHCRSMNSILPL